MTDMELFYESHVKTMVPVKGMMQPGRLYAALIATNWVRVQLNQYDSPDKVNFQNLNRARIPFIDCFPEGESFPGGLWRH